jgi:uncharacterized repeat protein (TIGR02543 family)
MSDTKVVSKSSFKLAVGCAILFAGILIALGAIGVAASSASASSAGPEGASMTMYDYTVDTTEKDQSVSGDAALWAQLTMGINSADGTAPGHLLKFRKANDNALSAPAGQSGSLLDKYQRSKINQGSSVGSSGDHPDATEPVLDASGYPVLHDLAIPASESLNYLFDDSVQTGKLVYPANASTLLQQSGTQWSYNSGTTSALFDTGTGDFALAGANGGFFPFGGNAYGSGNHYFGMQFTQPFTMTKDGKDLSGNAMTFTFSGDDDVFFSIDGVVVSSLVGGLRQKSVSINMETGKVTRTNFKAAETTETTLGQLFQDAGVTGKTTGDILSEGAHTFKMWYLEQGNFGSGLSMSYNLIPRYANLNYDMNGGEGSIDSVSVEEKGTAEVTGEVPVRDGFTFTGWNSQSDGTGTSYTAGDSITLHEDLTLYAQWKRTAFTLDYDPNGGTGSQAQQVGNGTVSLEDFTGMSRDGYTLIAWTTQRDNGTPYLPGDSFNLTKDTTLYALWVKDLVATWHANGGAGANGETSVETTFKVDVKRVADSSTTTGWDWTLSYPYQASKDDLFTGDGYQFASWNTQADGSGSTIPDVTTHGGATLTAVVHNMGSDTVDMYAQWVPLVTYDSNGGTGADVVVVVKDADHELRVSDQGFTRDGFAFAGYNTEKDGTGTSYAVGDTATVTAPTTLYAQWKELTAVLPSTGSSTVRNSILAAAGSIVLGVMIVGALQGQSRRRNS